MRIKPRLSRGLRDLLPPAMLARQRLIDTARKVYESYGFAPLETPAIEYLDVLSGSAGEEAQRSIFRVTNPEEEELGLRFDLTVPLARVVSQHPQIAFPFKRYQVAQVWRADKPDPGRYRQFTQFDIDSVGAPCGTADTEVLAAICDCLDAIEAGPYQVRFSSRGILNLLRLHAGIPARHGTDVFRVLDKLAKVGWERVSRELTSGYVDSSGDSIRGLGLDSDQVAAIEAFLAIKGADRQAVIGDLRALLANVEGAGPELDTVEGISADLDTLGYGRDRVVLDVSIARGLAYYTGPVFEAVLLDAPQFGSVFGGGRYDGLVSRFGGQPIPATGASMGVDRLLAALEHLGRAGKGQTPAQVLVTVMDRNLRRECLRLAFELRRGGVRTDIHVGSGRLGKQLKRANRLRIPYAILIGENELARGLVTVKQMSVARSEGAQVKDHESWKAARFGQIEIPRGEVVARVRQLLAGGA